MRTKIYIIAGGIPGQAIMKSRAMGVDPVVNLHFLSPQQLASEICSSYGFCGERETISQSEAVFLMDRILRENRKKAGENCYFTARSIADALSALQAMNRLRHQLSAFEDELSGLERLLGLGDSDRLQLQSHQPEQHGQPPAGMDRTVLIRRKNQAIGEELLKPYLEALRSAGLEDSVGKLRRVITSGAALGRPLMDGCGMMVEERPLSPLERQLVETAFATVERIGEEELVGGGNLACAESALKMSAYGASNEVRAILEDIQAEGRRLDQCLIACVKPEQYAPLFREYGNLPLRIATGRSAGGSRVCLLAETLLRWHRSAYTKEMTEELFQMLDWTPLRREMEKDGLETVEIRRLWTTVRELGKQLNFTLDTEENLLRLRAYRKLIQQKCGEICGETEDDGREQTAETSLWRSHLQAFPYCEMFARMLTVDDILSRMVFLRDGDSFQMQSHSVFLTLLRAARRMSDGSDILLLPSVIQLLKQQMVCREEEEPQTLFLCSWDRTQFYHRSRVYICGLQELAGSVPENSILLDGDIEWIQSRVTGSDLETTGQKVRRRSEDFLRIVEGMRRRGVQIILSWSDYSLSQLKPLAVPAVVSSVEGLMKERAVFSLKPWRSGTGVKGDAASGELPAAASGELPAKGCGDGLGQLPLLTVTPSAAERLLTCPYSFVLTKLLHIREPEDAEEQTAWLTAAEKGSLCHSAFETYVHWERDPQRPWYGSVSTTPQQMDEKRRMMDQLGERLIGEYGILKPFRGNEERSVADVKAILDSFVALWETIPQGQVEMTETAIEDRPVVQGRLQCHGIPDLIMRFDGMGVGVLDYKTGKTVKHKENDVKTCVQTLLYCLMLAQKEYPDETLFTRYLYPLAGTVVGCNYSKTVETEIRTQFENAIQAMETGVRWRAVDGQSGAMADVTANPACLWCKLKPFCQRESMADDRWFDKLGKGRTDDDR